MSDKQGELKPYDFVFDKGKGYLHWSERIKRFDPEPSEKPIIFYGTR